MQCSLNIHILSCSPYPLVVCMICSPVIQQSPKHLLQTLEEKEEKLFCRYSDSSYQYIFWYQQKSNGGYLELIGMLSYGTASLEEKIKPQFNITGHAKEDTFLHISSISVEDSAIYFCAASLHSHTVPFKRWQQTVHFAPIWLIKSHKISCIFMPKLVISLQIKHTNDNVMFQCV